MKINSPLSDGPHDKELITLIKAINCQMKSKTSFKKSNSLPVLITLSVENYIDYLFNNPGEELESMQGSVRGAANLTLLSSDEDVSMLDVLATFNSPHPISISWWKLVSPRQTQTIRTSCTSEVLSVPHMF